MLKRLLLGAVALLGIAASASAQTTTITATHLSTDFTGTGITGKLCLQPVLNGQPSGFTLASGGQVTAATACFTITSGAISGVVVPDVTLIHPAGIGYDVVIQSSAGVPLYHYPQPIYPSGTTWNLDNWSPTQVGITYPNGLLSSTLAPQGNCGTSPAIWYTSTAVYDCYNQIWVTMPGAGGGGGTAFTGGTLTSPLYLSEDPLSSSEAVTLHYFQSNTAFLPLAGGTLTGAVTLAADPTTSLGAATKNYVDTKFAAVTALTPTGTTTQALTYTGGASVAGHAATFDGLGNEIDAGAAPCLLTGCTFTGATILSGDPTTALGAATKQYVDAATGSSLTAFGSTTQALTQNGAVTAGHAVIYDSLNNATDAGAAPLLLTGGTLTGSLLLNADPTAALGAATKQYVDASSGAVTATYPLVKTSSVLSVAGTVFTCADNSICGGPVDGNGNPAFATYAASTITVGGSSGSPLVINDYNGICQITTTQTLTASGTAGPHYVYGVTTFSGGVCTLTLVDTTTVGWAWHEKEIPATTGTSGNPQYGFDIDLGQYRSNTGSTWSSALTNQMVPLFDYYYNGSAVQVLGQMPYGISGEARYQAFGTGALGQYFYNDTSITTHTLDGCNNFASFIISNSAYVSPTLPSGTVAATGICFTSQWPVLIGGSAQITSVGLGQPGYAGNTTNGTGPDTGGLGGAGGCGGNSGATTSKTGGHRMQWTNPWIYKGGCGAGSTTVGQSASGGWTLTGAMAPPWGRGFGNGAEGSAGAGDGTRNGGAGGNAGAPIFIAAPALIVGGNSANIGIHSDGGAGAAGTVASGSNAAGGGGGGAGNIWLEIQYSVFNGTETSELTANGGAAGTSQGTGTTGSAGGAGAITKHRPL